MTHDCYSTKRTTVWSQERDGQRGYAVKYQDGYISWCPEEAYHRDYRPVKGGRMTFGQAIESLKSGKRVRRLGWNGKGMFIVLMPELRLPPYSTQGTDRKVNDRTAKWIGDDAPLDCRPYLAMYTALKEWQPGWNASQADMLADDWEEIAAL